MKRREVLKIMGASTLFYLTGCTSSKLKPFKDEKKKSAIDPNFNWSAISPINRDRDKITGPHWSGDNPEFMHQVLWDKAAFIKSIGGLPPISEKTQLVIIGGGMSGLMLAHHLKEKAPIILEQNQRMGGNAKGETWNGQHYSIAAAYFVQPDANSKEDQFLKEIGAWDIVTVKKGEDAVILDGKMVEGFHQGSTAGKAKTQFIKFEEYINDIAHSKNGALFPDIPYTDSKTKKRVHELDKESLYNHLTKILGKLHPQLETAIEHYCWSSLGGASTEISAAAGLNFLCGEVFNICVAKGGNAGIAEKILASLANTMPVQNFRNGMLVFDVKQLPDGVEISYIDQQSKIVKRIKSDYVAMSCPKFIAAKCLDQMENSRLELIKKLKYRSYMVANVLLKKPFNPHYYDVYLLGDGKTDINNPEVSSQEQKATDICIANFSDHNDNQSILTLYRGIPYDNFRPTLLDEGSYDTFKKEFTEQAKELTQILGLSPADIEDVRIARWGHPLPLAEVGLISKGIVDKINKPLGKRIYFCEQDNWMLPAFETAMAESFKVSAILKPLLLK